MKKLIICLIFLPFLSKAHNNIDSLKLSDGWVIKRGDTILVGPGTLPSKDFAYIYTSPFSIGGKTFMPSGWSYHKFIVKKIKTYKQNINTFDYIILTSGTIINWWCEAESAMKSGEIIEPKELRKE